MQKVLLPSKVLAIELQQKKKKNHKSRQRNTHNEHRTGQVTLKMWAKKKLLLRYIERA